MCFLACDTGITPVAAGYGGNSFALRRTHTQADAAAWNQVLPREAGLGAGSWGGEARAAHSDHAPDGRAPSPTMAHVCNHAHCWLEAPFRAPSSELSLQISQRCVSVGRKLLRKARGCFLDGPLQNILCSQVPRCKRCPQSGHAPGGPDTAWVTAVPANLVKAINLPWIVRTAANTASHSGQRGPQSGRHVSGEHSTVGPGDTWGPLLVPLLKAA